MHAKVENVSIQKNTTFRNTFHTIFLFLFFIIYISHLFYACNK